MIWAVCAAITLIVIAVLLRPLFGHGAATALRQTKEVVIFRDQLAELDREIEANLVSADEAGAARVELERKILAAARQDSVEAPSAAGPWLRRTSAALIAGVAPLGAFAVYLLTGAPNEPAHPFAARTPAASETGEHGVAEIESMVQQLAARLEREPGNLEGWVLLARSYAALRRHGEAAKAYGKALELAPANMVLAADFAESLTYAAGGIVPPRALQHFEQANKADPSAPKPQFYLALGLAQAGKSRDAIDRLKSLEKDSPADAPWLPGVRELIASIAQEAGIDAAGIEGGKAAPDGAVPAPSDEDVAAAQQMTPEQQQDMIQGMVEALAQRLQANPDDLEGWKRLGRSYLVLNEPARARDAYGRAVALAPADSTLLADYAATLLAAPDAAPLLPEASVAALRELLSKEPDNGAALWLLGFAERAGRKDKQARELWVRLLQQLDPASAEHAAVKAQLDTLPAQN